MARCSGAWGAFWDVLPFWAGGPSLGVVDDQVKYQNRSYFIGFSMVWDFSVCRCRMDLVAILAWLGFLGPLWAHFGFHFEPSWGS